MKECSIIRDLLPLYTEHMTSEDTRSYVDAHIAHCADCRSKLDKLSASLPPSPTASAVPLKVIRKQLARRRAAAALVAASWMLALLLAVFAYLTAPQYLPYADDLITVTRQEGQTGENGDCLLLTFRQDVAGCDVSHIISEDGRSIVYTISAYTTLLDRLNPPCVRFYTATIIEPSSKFSVYYAQNQSQSGTLAEDVLIYGEDLMPGGGMITLPRLTLGYYALIAAALFGLLVLAALLFRRAKRWLIRLSLLPLSYIIGHLCIKGLSATTYTLQRDLALILLVALLVFTGAALVLRRTHQRK